MADYILFPVSNKGLAGEMRRLVDDYQEKAITQDVLLQTLKAWKQNCDFMLDEQGEELSPSITRLIGKRRALVVSKALDFRSAV